MVFNSLASAARLLRPATLRVLDQRADIEPAPQDNPFSILHGLSYIPRKRVLRRLKRTFGGIFAHSDALTFTFAA